MKNSVRIIAGRWRGRKLTFFDAPDLRPTSGRLKETLFNWLSPTIQNTRCLDLFAGSGALAWEALSRGASQVILVDSNKKITQHLTRQTQILDCQSQTTIIHGDSLKWLSQSPELEKTEKFDLIFLDPPFKKSKDYILQVCELINQKKILSENGMVYLETSCSAEKRVFPTTWKLLRNKKVGGVYAYLFHLRSKID